MQDSSADRVAVLGKVRPRHVYTLLDIIHRSTVRDIPFIAERFGEAAPHFAETLFFLEEIGWLESEGGRLVPVNDAISRVVASSGTSRDLVLAEELFSALGPYEKTFADYLAQFCSEGGELVHSPIADRRLLEAEARDFLMELGAVTHRMGTDSYVISEPFAHLGLWARNVRAPADVNFNHRAQERSQLGRAAELAALEWEKQRVGREWADRVRHVAAKHPAACFDIQSVTIDRARTQPRFIEVKAVAADSFEFHWSRAEIEAAQILGLRYFLYLLPVRSQGIPDANAVEVIQNPYSAVYQNSEGWLKAEADIVCRRNDRRVS
jgi:hypothetical protein